MGLNSGIGIFFSFSFSLLKHDFLSSSECRALKFAKLHWRSRAILFFLFFSQIFIPDEWSKKLSNYNYICSASQIFCNSFIILYIIESGPYIIEDLFIFFLHMVGAWLCLNVGIGAQDYCLTSLFWMWITGFFCFVQSTSSKGSIPASVDHQQSLSKQQSIFYVLYTFYNVLVGMVKTR